MEKVSGIEEVTFQLLSESKVVDFDNYIFTVIFNEILVKQKVSPIGREIRCRKFDPRVEILNPNLSHEDEALLQLLMEKGVIRYTVTIN